MIAGKAEVTSSAVKKTLQRLRQPRHRDPGAGAPRHGFGPTSSSTRCAASSARVLSAGQIAAKIGAPTRNIVIGKIARLGLKRAAAPAKPKPVVVRKPIAVSAPVKVAKPTPPAKPPKPEPVEAKPATTAGDAAPSDAITIHELRDHRCHWPFGDPRDDGFRYCGAPVPRDREDWEPCYCAGHRAIAYTPAKGRGR